MIKIDKGIPHPGKNKNSRKYPYSDMEVGDSFIVKAENYNAVRQSLFNYKKGKNCQFSLKKHDGNYRCWRIK